MYLCACVFVCLCACVLVWLCACACGAQFCSSHCSCCKKTSMKSRAQISTLLYPVSPHRLSDLRSHPCFAFQCSVICAQITQIWCKASKNHFFGAAQFCSRSCCNKSWMQWSVDIYLAIFNTYIQTYIWLVENQLLQWSVAISRICAVTPGLVFQRNLCTEISDLIRIAEKLL